MPNSSPSPENTPARISRFLKLLKLDIKQYKKRIWKMSREELVKNFGGGPRYPVNVNRLMLNIIWQVRGLIIKGRLKPVDAVIRNFWYRFVKPTLSRADALNPDYDQYKTLIKNFVRLVRNADIIRYRDFGFVDEGEHVQSVGQIPHVILFAEKDGHYPMLQRLAQRYEVSIISLGGKPSLLSVEYFVDRMRARGVNLRESFYLVSFVDWDPSGWVVWTSFVRNLKFFGVPYIHHVPIVIPERFTDQEIDINKYRIVSSKETRKHDKKWILATGGINDELYGLEADALDLGKMREVFGKIAGPWITDAPQIRRVRAFRRLSDEFYHLVRVRHAITPQKARKTP